MSGKLWIGRQNELQKLEKEIFLRRPDNSYTPKTYALVGPIGMGKQRLLEEAVSRFERDGHPGVFLFRRDFNQSGSEAVLLKDYALDMRVALTEDVLRNAPVPDPRLSEEIQTICDGFEKNRNQIEENPRLPTVAKYSKRHFYNLLQACTKLGFHVILLLTSFDAMLEVYSASEEAWLPDYLFSLSRKGSSRLNLSVLLLSERMPRFLVKKDGSLFEKAYPPITLRPFNDDEMKEYFQSYATLCGVPDNELRSEILSLAGRFPDTLMDLRKRIEENGIRSQDAVSVRELIPERSAFYRHLCKLMRSQWVDPYGDGERHTYAMDVFRRYFLENDRSPATLTNMGQLYTFGLVDRRNGNEYTPLTEFASGLSAGNSDFLAYMSANFSVSAKPGPGIKLSPGTASEVKCAWLHMSDLHVRKQARTVQIMEHYKALAEHLKKKGRAPDFLVLTGDFRHQVWKTQFNLAEDFLKNILEIFGIERKDVFLVPGNHDVGKIPPDTAADESRAKIIREICDKSDNEEAYTDYHRDIRDWFSEYDAFVRNFYKGSGVDDERMVSPSAVYCIPWRNTLNLLCVNTALISDGDRSHKEILDIKALYEDQIPSKYPTIMLGHHGIDALTDAQRPMVCQFMQDKRISAYLHGDIHQHGEQPIYPVRMANAANPPAFGIACGKSAPQAGDDDSDVGVIYYTWREDGQVYPETFSWDMNGFYPDMRWHGLSGIRSFPMRLDLVESEKIVRRTKN